jgi:hypothetical protein
MHSEPEMSDTVIGSSDDSVAIISLGQANEKVAAMFKEAHVKMHDVLLSKLRVFQPEKDPDIIEVQAEIMMELLYGSDIRNFTKREMNNEKLCELHDTVLASLFEVKIER